MRIDTVAPPEGACMAFVELESLGKALGLAADAVGKLGDSIAHLISLGNQGFNAVQAGRTRERLKDIDARLVQLNNVANVTVVNSIQEYIKIWETNKKRGIVIGQLDESDRSDWFGRPRDEWDMSIVESWKNIYGNVNTAILDVTDLLADLREERSDFILEESYNTLYSILRNRVSVLEGLGRNPPVTPSEIERLRALAGRYDRLRKKLASTIRTISEYLRRS
jgi:hypothetical protein